MPGLDGVELARVLRRFAAPPALIFVSAYESAAVEAFELRALDYLMKPVSRARVAEALGRIEAKPTDTTETLAVDAPGGGTRLIQRADILYLQAHGDYVRVRHRRRPPPRARHAERDRAPLGAARLPPRAPPLPGQPQARRRGPPAAQRHRGADPRRRRRARRSPAARSPSCAGGCAHELCRQGIPQSGLRDEPAPERGSHRGHRPRGGLPPAAAPGAAAARPAQPGRLRRRDRRAAADPLPAPGPARRTAIRRTAADLARGRAARSRSSSSSACSSSAAPTVSTKPSATSSKNLDAVDHRRRRGHRRRARHRHLRRQARAHDVRPVRGVESRHPVVERRRDLRRVPERRELPRRLRPDAQVRRKRAVAAGRLHRRLPDAAAVRGRAAAALRLLHDPRLRRGPAARALHAPARRGHRAADQRLLPRAAAQGRGRDAARDHRRAVLGRRRDRRR